MKFNKINLLTSSLFTIGLVPNLVSCSKVDVEADINIDPYKVAQCSNNTIATLSPSATFHFNLNNIRKGDILTVSVTNQEKDGVHGSFIQTNITSHSIKLRENQTDVDVQFVLLSDIDKLEIFEVHFSISCTIKRHNNIILKKIFNDLYFENATSTTSDMFLYESDAEGNKILAGWKQEEWVQEQLTKCNIMVLPNDIVEIKQNAFSVEVTPGSFQTTIPENIKYIYLDSTFNHNNTLSQLKVIGENAFRECRYSGFNNLNLPITLTTVGQSAFYDCVQMTGTVTLGPNLEKISEYGFFHCNHASSIIFNSMCVLENGSFGVWENLTNLDVSCWGSNLPSPSMWTENNFKFIPASTEETPRTVYLSSLADINDWSNYLSQKHNENFANWRYLPIR